MHKLCMHKQLGGQLVYFFGNYVTSGRIYIWIRIQPTSIGGFESGLKISTYAIEILVYVKSSLIL